MYFPTFHIRNFFIFGSGPYCVLQWGQSFRASLWETITRREEEIRSGSTPRFTNRWIVWAAELVWSVENTIWPVIEASIASFAVSSSRISPTIIISGSCRSSDLSHFAKVNWMAGLICVWFTPGILYSTGSSRVEILFSSGSYCDSRENSVVDLPEPVGPTARIIP